MLVRIRLFARLRELAGAGELERDVAPGTTASGVWDLVVRECPALAGYTGVVSCAVNDDYAKLATALREGDEVAFLPPVSGGASG
jgi:molybdopterin converting factor subunit 1